MRRSSRASAFARRRPACAGSRARAGPPRRGRPGSRPASHSSLPTALFACAAPSESALRTLLDLPARDLLRVPDAGRDRGAAQPVRLEALAGLEALPAEDGRCASGRGGTSAARRGCDPRCARTSWEAAARAGTARRCAWRATSSPSFWYSISTSRCCRMPSVREPTSFSSARAASRLGRLGEVELAECLLELAPDALERRVRVGGDHRPDELERQSDRPRLERCQPRRRAERVAEELLVDVHLAVLELGVDGVAAAAEVDEVQELEVLLERLRRDVEALGDVGGRNDDLASPRRSGRAGRRAAPGADPKRSGGTPGSRAAPPPRRPLPRSRRRPWAALPSCRFWTRSRSSRTSLRSSGGARGTARPSWRRIHAESRPRFE